MAQVENPRKGDWAGTVSKDLKQLGIGGHFEEIKMMSTESHDTAGSPNLTI